MAVIEPLLAEKKIRKDFPLIRKTGVPPIPAFDPGKELLSVVIPYYNMGRFLPETIQSIRSSEYKNIEIVLVNDGSTEPESITALAAYAKDPSIRIIHKKNAGLALARNTGALEAKGEFIAFLDPDDTVAPPYYKHAVRILKAKTNISFAGAWCRYFGASDNVWPNFSPEPPYALLHNTMSTGALVFKTKHFLDAGLNDARMIYGMEDYESLVGMLAKGYRGVAFPETWFNYRIRKDSMAQAFTTDKKLYLYKIIAYKYPDFYGKHAAKLFLILNSNGPSINIDNPTFEESFVDPALLWKRISQLEKANKALLNQTGDTGTNNLSDEDAGPGEWEFANGSKLQEIKAWYHKEYEILPLWYKRFGHLIKIAMGKRKFRK
jgi:glycosyltransferase involved in cell wall biosynthesis